MVLQSYVGGFNIGDEYLGLGKLGYWRDTHLRIQGDAVDALQLRFILDWNSQAHRPQFEYDEKYFLKRINHSVMRQSDCLQVVLPVTGIKLNMVIQK